MSGPGEREAERHLARAAALDRLHRDRRVGPRSYVLELLRGLVRAERPAAPRRAPPALDAGDLCVTFGGHATLLARWRSGVALVDPHLGGWVGPARRAEAPGLEPAELRAADVVLITHAHRDHLDPATLALLPRRVPIVAPPGTRAAIARLGFRRIVELEPGAHQSLGGLELYATPARHRASTLFERRGACGYVIRGDGATLYAAGDTGYFSGFGEIGRRHRPDVAALPISGYSPAALRADHLSPLDALYAFEDLGAQILLPIHHGAFALSYEPLDEPARWLAALARERQLTDRLALLRAGQTCRVRAGALAVESHEPGG